jgi:hypothetical protein
MPMKEKQPPGPPMTLGNVREQGVHHLIDLDDSKLDSARHKRECRHAEGGCGDRQKKLDGGT